jgi:ABC-type antimicrobial peptide transport system permease subunit
MSPKSIFIILSSQLKQKWGRFLLASAGIMIGVWAITLTTSLSFGLSDTLVNAINSQPGAREFTLSQTQDRKGSFFELTEAPKFISLGNNRITEIKEKNPEIRSVVTNYLFNLYILDQTKLTENVNFSCISPTSPPINTSVNQNLAGNSQLPLPESNCEQITVRSQIFESFYETNKKEWLGQKNEPKGNEIVSCYKCGNLNFNEKLGVKSPQEMIGKEISLEWFSTPVVYKEGEVIDVLTANTGSNQLTKPKIEKFKIVSVINDIEQDTRFGSPSNFFSVDKLNEAIFLNETNNRENSYGASDLTVWIDSYNNLDRVIENLKGQGYLPFSLTQSIVSSVKVVFNVLTWVLAAFGFIALITSIFGIINVMTISVLERQKEIGILKAIGARDGDIFRLFLLESILLGFIGWLLGTILALIFGSLISLGFNFFINSNKQWKDSLEALNISTIGPSYPWQLLLITLALAVFFTAISGLIPAWKASRQNPVESLRSE